MDRTSNVDHLEDLDIGLVDALAAPVLDAEADARAFSHRREGASEGTPWAESGPI